MYDDDRVWYGDHVREAEVAAEWAAAWRDATGGRHVPDDSSDHDTRGDLECS